MSDNKKSVVSYMLSRMDGILEERSDLYSLSEKAEINSFIDLLKADFQKMQLSYDTKDDDFGVRILEQQENERQRIARELHDTTIQVLTNLVHKTELCMKVMDIDPIRARLELEIINNTIRYTINELRNIIHNLRPMAFDDFGLDTTLERVVSQIKSNTEIEMHLNLYGKKENISSVVALTLVRIIQEACSNAIKHSEARNIFIELTYLKGKVCLTIKDDGKGFNVDESYKSDKDVNSGFGLSMMKERVTLLSGEFKLTSELNKGTQITVVVPIQ